MEHVGELEQACEERGSGREWSGPVLQDQMDKFAWCLSMHSIEWKDGAQSARWLNEEHNANFLSRIPQNKRLAHPINCRLGPLTTIAKVPSSLSLPTTLWVAKGVWTHSLHRFRFFAISCFILGFS